MSNYTTKTASLRATTIDTRKIDTKQIDTKVLKLNGEEFDPNNVGKVKTLEITWGDGYWNNDDGYWSYEMSINDVYYSGGEWYPLSVYINHKEVCCEKKDYAGGWEFYVAEPDDDLSQIYGGITDTTHVTIYYQLRYFS